MNLVKAQVSDKIATLIFNNPQKKNALSSALLQELTEHLSKFKTQDIRAIIIKADDQATVWSSGHDIDELSKHSDPLGFNDPLEIALRAIKHCPIPIIAMVHGSVWGGACDLAISCDLIVGDETAQFAITPTKIGLPYNLSGVLQFCNRVGINIAKEMFFTALPINADRALQIGLLNHLVSAKILQSFTYDLANTIAQRAPLSIQVVKEQIQALTSAHALNSEQIETLNAKRQIVFESQDYQEGITAFHEKRMPQFKGN